MADVEKTVAKKFLKKIWQFEKNKFIFASQNKILKQQNMLRTILHNEIAVSVSHKGYDTSAGACFAAS
jgi:uncharacterized Fe-S cluster-containing radical SAM superfamily protein